MVCSYNAICTLETPFINFIKTPTWPLLIYPSLTMSHKKVIFHIRYNKVEPYAVILRLVLTIATFGYVYSYVWLLRTATEWSSVML